MSNLVKQTSLKPSRQSNLPENKLATMRNRIEEKNGKLFLPIEDMPSGSLKGQMQSRLAELQQALSPAGIDAIRAGLTAVFAVKAHRSVGVDDAEFIFRIYLEDLRDLPLFALSEALIGVRKSAERWMPQAGEIREFADAIARPFVKEAEGLRRLLSAVALPPPVGVRPMTVEERREAIARAKRPEHVEEPMANRKGVETVSEIAARKAREKSAAEDRLAAMAREVGNEWHP